METLDELAGEGQGEQIALRPDARMTWPVMSRLDDESVSIDRAGTS